MYFTKIVLHNFGLYKGTHTLQLFPRQGKRNITLIGGLNGRGKTTILEAVFLAFYGNRSMQAIQDRKTGSYPRLLDRHVNKTAEDPAAYVEVHCVLEEKGNQELKIRRSWKKREKNKNISDQLEVYVNGERDLILAQNWNYYVEEILPVSIARFFFFDNEKIKEIAEDESFEQIKSSIKSIMGIQTIELLMSDMKKLVKDKSGYLSQTENQQLQKEREDLSARIKSLREHLDDLEEKKRQLSMEIGKLTGRIQLVEEQFWHEGGYLGIRKADFEKQKESLNLEKGKLDEKIRNVIMDAKAPLILCEDLVYETLEHCKKNERIRAQQYSASIIRELQGKIRQKLRMNIQDDRLREELVSLIEEEFESYGVNAAQKECFVLSPMSDDLLSRLTDTSFSEILELCHQLLAEYQKVDDDLIQINNHLNHHVNELEAKELYRNIQSLKEDKAAKAAELRLFEKERSVFDGQLRQLEKRENDIIGEIAANDTKMSEVGRIVKYATMSLNLLDEFKTRLQGKKVADLEANITKCFQYLVGKKNMLNKIRIDGETLDIILLDSDGKELLKNQLSAGEQQIFAVSVLWGLALSSGYRMPVIIDTPMARLDSAHRNNFVGKYLPNASEQVLVLSTDEEIYGKYLDVLRPYINVGYTLLYDDADQSSSITPGYFGEDVCL